jgi:uncharacterized repeat protein (TIGR04052 family)
MILAFNSKSILLAIVIAFSSYNLVQAQSDTKEVAINFEGWVGEDKFACGESYDQVGTAETTITPIDFRFYVSNVALIDQDGNAVPLELKQDGKWQHENTALLDFENGTGACNNGTAETNGTIVGNVPTGDYQSLQFTLGVPKKLNHDDAAIAPSPLNLTSMWWNWQGGYKFLRVDLKTDKAIANVSANSTHSNSGNSNSNVPINQPTSNTHTEENTNSNSYSIHLGSTGCKDSAQSDLFGCVNPNRTTVTLENFNSDDNVVVVDIAELLYESNLTNNQSNTPAGCISSPEDNDCNAIMQRLGLPFNGATSTAGQQFFFVE